MSTQQKAIDAILKVEGGYVHDPKDSGGETNFGITKHTALLGGYYGPMRSMKRETAYAIYVKLYWNKMSLDKVAKLSDIIAEETMDTGVNMGVARAGEFLQRSLNILNSGQAHFADVRVDGQIGAKTVHALNFYIERRGKRGEKVLFSMLNALQGAYYVRLAERRSKDERFIFGWFSNRVA